MTLKKQVLAPCASTVCQHASVITADAASDGFAAVSPNWQVFALLFFMLLFWTLIPILGHHSPPLDVVEMHTWAQVPQLGYYKHPPLPAWGIYLSEAVFGQHPIALFFPGALSITLSLAFIWPLARIFFGPQKAVVAMFLQASVAYYHLYSGDYNHNVAQMPCWALAVTAAYFALRDGGKRWFLLLGLSLGFSGLSKYSGIFLPLAAIALVMWDKDARRHLHWHNLLISVLAALLVISPHLYWLWRNDFAALNYAQSRLAELAVQASWGERFISYLGMQIAVHIVPLLVLAYLYWRKRAQFAPQIIQAPESHLNRRFLLVIGLGPFALTLLLGLSGTYLHPMWASAMFPLSGLLAVYALGELSYCLRSRRAVLGWLLMMSFFGFVYAAKNTTLLLTLTGKYQRAAYPGPELAAQLDARWQTAFPGKPMRYIIGTPWEAGVASFFSQAKPQVLINGDLKISPWIGKDELLRCGAMIISGTDIDFASQIQHQWPTLQRQSNFVLVRKEEAKFFALNMAWALIPPQGNCQ